MNKTHPRIILYEAWLVERDNHNGKEEGTADATNLPFSLEVVPQSKKWRPCNWM